MFACCASILYLYLYLNWYFVFVACYAGSGNDGGATLYFVAVTPRRLSIGAALCLRPFHTTPYHTIPYWTILCHMYHVHNVSQPHHTRPYHTLAEHRTGCARLKPFKSVILAFLKQPPASTFYFIISSDGSSYRLLFLHIAGPQNNHNSKSRWIIRTFFFNHYVLR